MAIAAFPDSTNDSRYRAPGKVWLVGAGPGDADLLTLKALRVIQQADVIFYDNLVSHDICALFPSSTPAFYVGKKKGDHSVPQSQLNDLLVAKAKQGLTICRLKGGDPFVFGRGAEEMLVLKHAGIAVGIVPGITAASGCTAYAGIPLTHRGLTHACTFVTAHAQTTAHGEDRLSIDWAALAHMKQTLVFYMGLSRSEMISNNLQQHGMPSDMPVAIIERGCQQQQRVVVGTIATLPALVGEHALQSPSLIVVGEVVSLRDELAWFAQSDVADLALAQTAEKISA